MALVSPDNLDLVVKELKSGSIVCIPTETVYGLAVDAAEPLAVEKLYMLKNRPKNKPFALAIEQPADIYNYVDSLSLDTMATNLIHDLLPGALTLILKAKSNLSYPLCSNDGKVGIRCSSHHLLQKILNSLGNAICLTSANMSGAKDGVNAKEIEQIFGDQVLILADDSLVCGTASTIVDLTAKPYKIVRQGLISETQLAKYAVIAN